jgi:hypothetical protein
MISAVEIMKCIDPSLHLLEAWKTHPREGVMKVAREGGSPLVLRYSNNDYYFKKEHEALLRLEGIKQTPDLVQIYEANTYHALLKTFQPGETISEYGGNRGELIERMWELVSSVHNRGICNLEISPWHVLVEEGNLRLFDFDLVKFECDLSFNKFADWKKNDYVVIGEVFR